MSSDRLEARIDAALGPRMAVTTAAPLGLSPGLVAALRIATAIPGPESSHPLMMRAAFLTGVPAASGGALRRLGAALATDPDRFAANASGADLGTVRDWLTDARQANLTDLRERLEPDWTQGKKKKRDRRRDPELPDTLPELPDRRF